MGKFRGFLDDFRVFPRMFLLGFGYMTWQTWLWYTTLEVHSVETTAFASAIIATASFIVKNYSSTAKDKFE